MKPSVTYGDKHVATIMTPEGPLLIEGNGKPGVLMPQRAARRGLGDGRYGQLLAHHLATKA